MTSFVVYYFLKGVSPSNTILILVIRASEHEFWGNTFSANLQCSIKGSPTAGDGDEGGPAWVRNPQNRWVSWSLEPYEKLDKSSSTWACFPKHSTLTAAVCHPPAFSLLAELHDKHMLFPLTVFFRHVNLQHFSRYSPGGFQEKLGKCVRPVSSRD